MGAIFTRFYDGGALPFDRREALRYFGAPQGVLSPETEELFGTCVQEALAACVYRVCYAEFDIARAGGVLDLGFMKTDSRALFRNLEGCEKAVAFAATVGMGMERLIARYSVLSPVRGYAFQAIGAERIETLCNAFNQDIAREYAAAGWYARPRFSCGYGDFPIAAQANFIRALDCTRKIGITLSDGLLMTPSKSVTALIGFSSSPRSEERARSSAVQKTDNADQQTPHVREQCENCSAKDCRFRQEK